VNKHLATRLQAYHDGELHGRRLRQVEQHLSQCVACRIELETLQRLSSLLQRSPEAKSLTPPEQFVAQVGLKLPRHQKQPAWQRSLRIAWLMIPLGLLGVLAFVQTVFIVSRVILNILQLESGQNMMTGILPLSQQNAWQAGIYSMSEASLSSMFTTMLQWVQGGGPLGWGLMLSYGLLVVIGLLYWSWLAGWWIHRKHQQQLN